MTDTDQDALRAWLDLLTASNSLKKEIDASLRQEFGLSISRFDVLSALYRAGDDGLRAGELTQRLLVTDGATTQVTAPLIRDGLVNRAPSPSDGRAAIFSLTRKGEALFQRMALVHRGWIAAAFSGFTRHQITSLRRLLGKLELPGSDEASSRNVA